MLEVVKTVVSESGLVYSTVKNAKMFYAEQVKSIEKSSLIELARISPISVEAEKMYNELGMHGFIRTLEFYNYCTYVALHNIRIGRAFNCDLKEQDKEDYQQQSYIVLLGLFEAEEKEYSFSDFNYLCNIVSNRVMKKIAYAFRRLEMDSSFNLTKEIDGQVVSQTLEEVLTYRDCKIAKANAIQEKAFTRGINAMDLLEELENCLTYAENERLQKYLARKVDGDKLATKERVDLHRICKKIENYKIEMNTKAKELHKDGKKLWIELLAEKKAEKKQIQAIQAEARAEYKRNKFMNADKNLQEAKEMFIRRLVKVRASASAKGYVVLVSQLIELEQKANACPSQKQMRTLRAELNQASYELAGLNAEQVDNLKSLKAKAKALMNG